MSDATLRMVEREAAASADPTASARLKAERLRAGLCEHGGPPVGGPETVQACFDCLALLIFQEVKDSALGDYQRNLLMSREAWSGASLRGLAKKYGAKYAESRRGLMRRINEALNHVADHYLPFPLGFATDIVRSERGRRCAFLLVCGVALRWDSLTPEALAVTLKDKAEES